MTTFAHLTPETRALAEHDNERRIAYLAEDRWIDYPRAREALQELERLISSPQRTRMPGLLLHGESNIGKSMIIEKFLRTHSSSDFNARTGLLQIDILAVEMPPAPQERRLYGQLLMALNAPYRAGDRLATVEQMALPLLRKVGPRMIVVDEVHNLLAGSPREQRAALNLLKFLSNQLRCAVVVVGTRDALAAMQSDEQIVSRFPGLELPRWRENEDFRGFLAGFERQLPLKQASKLADSRAMVSMVMSATAGVTGKISALLSRAAEAAIHTGKERITAELLQSVVARARL